MDHKIPQSDIDFFDQNGFLIVRNALDTEQVTDLITAGDQLIGSKEQINRQCTNDGRYDGFRNTIALDSTFAELIDHERILPTVVQLLGASLKIMTSHLIYKYPDEEEGLTTLHKLITQSESLLLVSLILLLLLED